MHYVFLHGERFCIEIYHETK